MKRLFSIMALVAIAATIGSAGQWSPMKRQALRTDDGDQAVRTTQTVSHSAALQKTGSLTWVVVDSANNPYGAAGWNITPLSYDPGTNYVALIHRGRTGYGSSGQLWYNVSKDEGASWRRVSELNAGVAGNNSRYPSGAILNKTEQADSANAYLVYANPELSGGVFGGARYGVDGLGAGVPASVELEPPPYYSSQFGLWTDPVTGGVFWVGLETDATGNFAIAYHLFSTLDTYLNVTNVVPDGWADSTFQIGNAKQDTTKKAGVVGAYTTYDYMNGDSRNGNEYLGMLALFAGDTIAVADTNFEYNYNVGYAKSTDNGVTWGPWVRPQAGPSKNWNGLPGFGPSYYVARGYTSNRLAAHLVVDANGLAHFFTVVADTLTGTTSVVEIYETSANVWADKFVKTGLNRHTIQIFGALDQDSWDISATVSPDGSVIGVAWLDAATSAATDTIPDIWFAHRTITGTWDTPENLTQSPDVAEMIMHVASRMKDNGGNPHTYTIFLTRAYELNSTAFPPVDTNPGEFFATSFTFTQLPEGVNEKTPVAGSFALKQNYPNPFNPATRIEYAIAKGSNVKVVVYNVLGQEVATLVNEFKNAGTYSVDFNASRLASGVYMYSIKAGSYTDVKKMVLLK